MRGDAQQNYAALSWHLAGSNDYIVGDGQTWPALGDIDGDGKAEIVVGFGPSQGAKIRAFEDYLWPMEAGDFTNGWLDLSEGHPSVPIRPAIRD